jgi:hypothetical protein
MNLVVFAFITGAIVFFFIGMISGMNKEHDKWLDRGYALKKKNKPKK